MTMILTCLRIFPVALANAAVRDRHAHSLTVFTHTLFLPCPTPLLPLPLSALLLLLVTEAGGQLPALWPSTVTRSTETVQTHTKPHTCTEEEPRLPRVNWGRGLAKGPGGKWRSLDWGTRVILACSAKPDRLNDHRSSANTAHQRKRETYNLNLVWALFN